MSAMTVEVDEQILGDALVSENLAPRMVAREDGMRSTTSRANYERQRRPGRAHLRARF